MSYEELQAYILRTNPITLSDAVARFKTLVFVNNDFITVADCTKLILWMTESFPAVA